MPGTVKRGGWDSSEWSGNRSVGETRDLEFVSTFGWVLSPSPPLHETSIEYRVISMRPAHLNPGHVGTQSESRPTAR